MHYDLHMNARALLAAGSLALLAGCSTPMQPGLWEMTLTTRLDGHVQKVPVARQCVTQKDIDDPIRTLPRPNGTCKLSNVERRFDRATYDIECTRDMQTMQGRADIAFAGDRYDGTVTMSVTDKGAAAEPLAIAISARRVGDCTK
jgi:hypothetical protein